MICLATSSPLDHPAIDRRLLHPNARAPLRLYRSPHNRRANIPGECRGCAVSGGKNPVPGDWVSELTRDGRHETALQQFRDRMTDSRSNLSDFTAVQRVRGDLSDAVQSALQSGHGKRHVYFAAYSARLTGQWRAALKDFWQLIATSLKRRAILNRYRRVMKRQRADEAKISSPHIRHFGLKAKPRFAPDM